MNKKIEIIIDIKYQTRNNFASDYWWIFLSFPRMHVHN